MFATTVGMAALVSAETLSVILTRNTTDIAIVRCRASARFDELFNRRATRTVISTRLNETVEMFRTLRLSRRIATDERTLCSHIAGHHERYSRRANTFYTPRLFTYKIRINCDESF